MARTPETEERLNLAEKARAMTSQPKSAAEKAALEGRTVQPQELSPEAVQERRKFENQINAVTFNQSTGDTVLTTALFGLSYGALVGGFVATVAVLASNGAVSMTHVLGAMGLFGGFGAVASRMVAGERISAVKASAAGQQASLDKINALQKQVELLTGKAEAPKGMDLSVPSLREVITPPKGECDENCQKERLFKLNRWLTAFVVGAAIGLALWAAAAYAPGANIPGGLGNDILTGLGNLVGKGKDMAWLGASLLGGFTASTFGFNIPAISEKMQGVINRIGGRAPAVEQSRAPQQQPQVQPAKPQETPAQAMASEPEKNFSHVEAQKQREMNKPQGVTISPA